MINIYLKALEALHEDSAQKGFGVLGLALDGSPFPLGLTALPRSLPGHVAGRWSGGSPRWP
ncbi:MAG: hypothetical protein RQ885_13690 [Desulfurococcales archaeon]|nr:hypothetical protein [Desulfurococcales archaeon]